MVTKLPIAILFAVQYGRCMARKHIKIFATGGTIAGIAGSATRRDYRPGQIGIEDFLGSIAKLDLPAELVGEQFANIGSAINPRNDQWIGFNSVPRQ